MTGGTVLDRQNAVVIGMTFAVVFFVLTSIAGSAGRIRSAGSDPSDRESRLTPDAIVDLQSLWRKDYNEKTRLRRDLTTPADVAGKNFRLPNRCLDDSGAMDKLLAEHKMVYFLMPALGAGSTVKHFVSQCMVGKRSFADTEDNILNKWHEGKDMALREAMTDSLEVQTVLVSHAYRDATLVDLMKHATTNSLIVYVHREETDRMKASIRHIVERLCPEPPEQCKLKENEVLEAIAKQGTEMELGMSQILTCDTYDAVAENRPNLVFMNMKELDRLFPLVIKHHCPHREGLETIPMNTHLQRRMIYVELNKGIDKGASGNIYFVDLADWIEHKGEILEYVMDYKKDVTCQATTRNLEDDLFSCPTQSLLLSGGWTAGLRR